MSENPSTSREVKTTGPDYLVWRGELLARLALSRLESTVAYEGTEDQPYDFLIVTADGFCFFVEVKAFSSTNLHIDRVETIAELKWRVSTELLRQANQSHSPVVLFLFDADTDHGRFLRIDTLHASKKSSHLQTIGFPIENVINKESLESLIRELQSQNCEGHSAIET